MEGAPPYQTIHYIPIKRSRFGVKLFELCESSSGYIFRFRIYVGKDNLL